MGKVGSFVVCSITSDHGQEYEATSNTKEQRASFNCLRSDTPGEQSKALNGEHSLPLVCASSSFLVLNMTSGAQLQNNQ